MLFETEVVECICHSLLHHQKPDFEGPSVIKASSYLLPFVLEAHRESLPRSCETSARRLSTESAEVYSTADLSTSAAHIPLSLSTCSKTGIKHECTTYGCCTVRIESRPNRALDCRSPVGKSILLMGRFKICFCPKE